jgi:transposase
VPIHLRRRDGRAFLAALELPAASLKRIEVALALVDSIDRQLEPIDQELRAFARRQAGCRALRRQFGIGELTAPVILAELGDVGRLSSSRKAVRMAGLDVGVHRSDRRSRPGRLTLQGSAHLRWALYEAAFQASKRQSPDRDAYLVLRERMSHVRATITIARKLARRSFHTLRELGPAALEPVTD